MRSLKINSHPARRLQALPGLALAALLLCAPVLADLAPHSAVYKVKISILTGELRTRLSVTDDGYVAVHELEPKGMAKMFVSGGVEEVAGFRVEAGRVVPMHFSTSDSVSSDGIEADLRFDHDANVIVGMLNGEPVEEPIQGNVYDRVSIQYALMRDLMEDQSQPSYVLYEFDEFKPLEISRTGHKDVKVPAGRFEAIGIRHQSEGSSRVTTLWCVAELDYLPAVIEQHRNGKLNFRATLESYETGNAIADSATQ